MSAAGWLVLLAAAVGELLLARTAPARRLPKLVPWFSGAGRAIVALTTAAIAPESRAVLLLLALMAISRLITGYIMGVVQPAMRQSIVAVRVAEEYFERFRWSDYTSRRFGPVIAVMTVAQILGDVVLAIAGVSGAIPVALAALLGVYAVGELATHAAAIARWNRRQADALAAVAAEIDMMRPRVVLYTAALPESVVNLEHWLPALEASDEVGYIITRELATLTRLVGVTSMPIVYIKALGGLEALIPDSVELALYVDTSVRNNHLLRIGEITHVQLHHGESDKASSSSRLLRLYDHHFVAGSVAVDRLTAGGIITGAEQATIIGRPIATGLERRPVGRVDPTILYAPTWEGYHQDNAVSSLALGPAIATKLLANPRLRTTVRVHPLTGRVDNKMAAFVDQLVRLVSGRPSAEMSTDPSAAAAITALDRADVLVTDVSSMLSDFLYTGRPIVVVDAAGLGERSLLERYPTLEAAYVVRPDLNDFEKKLAAALGDDPLREQRTAVARRVLGDVDAGSGSADFAAALARLLG